MRSRSGSVLRGCLLGLLSAVLTATGHAAAGGALPELSLLVVLLPLLCAVLVTVAQRCTGVVGLVLVLGAGQLLLHTLLELLHPMHPQTPFGSTMFALHAVATAVTAVAVCYADAAVAAVGAALRRVLPRRPLLLVADRPLPTAVPAAAAVGRRLAGALAGAHVRRGPPLGC